ncbi:hypothetical protein IU449_08030 [Nocardia higoensis]|uniref:Uncharacterized protein n=1 Tax=Nocardia higoensis TaxID=228599 RepID=A0ABS0D7P8_9NOCA|nr:hypothetical protein [Nocardia higoensis]
MGAAGLRGGDALALAFKDRALELGEGAMIDSIRVAIGDARADMNAVPLSRVYCAPEIRLSRKQP